MLFDLILYTTKVISMRVYTLLTCYPSTMPFIIFYVLCIWIEYLDAIGEDLLYNTHPSETKVIIVS